MRATRVPVFLPFPSGPPRSDGVHVMKVVRSLAAQHGLLDPKWIDDLSLVEVSGNGERWWNGLDATSKLRMGMGMAWEQWYLPQVPGVIHQPGEIQVDGIFMNIDGESLDVVSTLKGPWFKRVLHEVKVTWKSANTVGELGERVKGVSPNWLLETQTKAYAKGKGTDVVYVHMYFVNGDYSYPLRPDLRVWRVEYEQPEIDETWDRILGHLREAHQQESLGGL